MKYTESVKTFYYCLKVLRRNFHKGNETHEIVPVTVCENNLLVSRLTQPDDRLHSVSFHSKKHRKIATKFRKYDIIGEQKMKRYEYDAVLHEIPDNGGEYVAFPWNIKKEFGKVV